jgi:uncharacterized protein YggE
MDGDDAATPGFATPRVLARGEGSVDVAPDAATITVGVHVAKPNLAAARDEAASRAAAVIAAVKKAGIPAGDISTSGYRVYPITDTGADRNPILTRGYDVRNAVTVNVRDLERLPAVLDEAIAAGANQIDGPTFFIQHPEDAEDEARRLAMASARRRAEVLAATEGAALGRVRSIVDGTPHRGPTPRAAYRAMSVSDSGPATPIEAGTEQITATVEVVWELV